MYCLNRPFDDQTQQRIRLEAVAVQLIFEEVDSGKISQIASGISEM